MNTSNGRISGFLIKIASSLKSPAGLAATLLAVVVLLVFVRGLWCDFVNYDDNVYVTANDMVRSGLNWKSCYWAWTTSHGSNWHPLTWLSLMLDVQIYGVKPFGLHLTNLLLHATNTILVFRILSLATGAFWRSLLVAAIFGVHPLRVESVVWVSERKDVLSICLGLIAIELYIRFVQSGNRSRYLMSIGLFTMSLLAKPTLVTLPFLLLLMDAWALGRLEERGGVAPKSMRIPMNVRIGWLVVEKLPYLAVSIISSFVTAQVQTKGGAAISVDEFSFSSRASNAIVAYVRYPMKLVYPTDLAVFYPLPREWGSATVLGAAAVLLGISVAVVLGRRKYPWLALGWFWYLGTMVPMVGLVQVGLQSMADRYTYFPTLGLLIGVVWSIPERWFSAGPARTALAGVSTVILITLGVMSYVQISVWNNGVTLFTHALSVTDANMVSLTNMGNALVEQKRYGDAMPYLEEAAQIAPTWAHVWTNLGVNNTEMGRNEQAAYCFERSLRLEPSAIEIQQSFGVALQRIGKYVEARRVLEHVILVDPKNVNGRHSLAISLAHLGELDLALEQLIIAAHEAPDNAAIALDAGFLLNQSGNPGRAVEYLAKYVAQQPQNARAQAELGDALAATGRLEEARSHLEKAIEINPRLWPPRARLVREQMESNHPEQAEKLLRGGLDVDPENPEIHSGLAAALTRMGRTDEAKAEAALATRYGSDTQPSDTAPSPQP